MGPLMNWAECSTFSVHETNDGNNIGIIPPIIFPANETFKGRKVSSLSENSPGMAIAQPELEVDSDSYSDAPPWFTPKRLLGLFCIINMLNYIDRGTIASNGVNGTARTCSESGICTSGSGIQGDFGLTYFQDGFLSSAFMVGLLASSPIFASLAKSHNPFRLIGVGLSVWTLAAAGCGFSFGFWSIAICRMFVGVGEASFMSLAAPFIDDNAPPSQKTAWLAIFYMCIPVGIACGYVYGGLVGTYLNWRVAFWVEAILMLPFAISGFMIQPIHLKGFPSSDTKQELLLEQEVTSEVQNSLDQVMKQSPTSEESVGATVMSVTGTTNSNMTQFSRVWSDLVVLLRDEIYVINVLGYVAYNFVVGAYSYWGPKAGYAIYKVENADMLFGGLTIICGIFGTLAGGFVLDLMQATIPNAFKLLSGATFFGAIFCFGAFCSKTLYGFIPLFAVGELFIFAIQGPVNYICLHCVRPSLRPLSMAISTVSIHIFGDVPSSPIVGILQDYVKDWRVSVEVLTSILFISAGIWFIGIFLPSRDKYDEVSQHGNPATERSPLLDEDLRETSEFP